MFSKNRAESPEKSHYLAFSNNFDRTVIVAVITMRMVQVILNEVVDMIAMGYCLVTTTRAVLVPRSVACAMMIGRTPDGVMRADFYKMFLNER